LCSIVKNLRNLKLKNIKVGVKQRPLNVSDLLTTLLDNKSLTHLSLVDLGMGNSIEIREQISDFIIYNESLVKLNLRGNNLIKIRPMIQNLIRNCNSNIQKLILSDNDYEVYDIIEMLGLIEKDSLFNERQHFKLRYVCFSNCTNLYPFEFKIKKILDEFYQKRRKVFIQYKTGEQELVQKAIQKEKEKEDD
jgi:hypothetical protein